VPKIIVLNVTRIGQNRTWNYDEKTFGLEMSDDTPIYLWLGVLDITT